MKNLYWLYCCIICSLLQVNCTTTKTSGFSVKEMYNSSNLIITQVGANSFVHTSYLKTNDFGNVPCNGLIVVNNNEAIIFDTPTNDSSSAELIEWINQKLHCTINAVVATHFHNDCLGGLNVFNDKKIPSYASTRTVDLVIENKLPLPTNSFRDSFQLKVGKENAELRFFGEGHTRDNVVGYFSPDQILFGGCLIKELNATKGYLGDSNEAAWSSTVEKIKNHYPDVKIVIPGHGEVGNQKLLDYTIKLFQKK